MDTNEQFAAWPPRDFLIKSLVASIPETLASYRPESGQFGTLPWVCNDQNAVFPLAVAWATEHEDNPYYRSDEVLEAIAGGGIALVDAQDENGAWIFRKKDNSTWGQVHQPWTYSRWIRAYHLTHDALPEAARKRWEDGLTLGFSHISQNTRPDWVSNMTGHNQMALYIASLCFDNPQWRDTAIEYMLAIVDDQEMGGYWSEHYGPVISYNSVYIDILGIYYSYSKDDRVIDALTRAAKYHASILLPDGSPCPAIDERNAYHKNISAGNCGFTWTPEGRGYVLSQLWRQTDGGTNLTSGDFAAHMLLHSGEGTGIAPAGEEDSYTSILYTPHAIIKRDKPWHWTFTGWACAAPNRRWVMDRQNLIDVYHDDLGLVLGGGHTKLQAYWSTFTVGDPDLLKPAEPTEGEEYDFTPDIPLKWTPDMAVLTDGGDSTRMSLKYGGLDAQRGHGPYRIEAKPTDDGAFALTYIAPQGENAEAHVPLLYRGESLELASGEKITLGEEHFILSAEQVGAWFVYEGLKVSMPAGATLRWPERQNDQYHKTLQAPLHNAKLVLCLPFNETGKYTITLSSE